MYHLYPYIVKKYGYMILVSFLLMGIMSLTKSNQTAFRAATAAWMTYTLLFFVMVVRKNSEFAERRHQSGGKVCIYCGTDLSTMTDSSSCYLCKKPNKIA